jgi:hypothetical protein
MKYKLILILVMTFLVSCGTLEVSTNDSLNGRYDYNEMNYIYSRNPRYFDNGFYTNQHGIQVSYRNHPYYIRYMNERESDDRRYDNRNDERRYDERRYDDRRYDEHRYDERIYNDYHRKHKNNRGHGKHNRGHGKHNKRR